MSSEPYDREPDDAASQAPHPADETPDTWQQTPGSLSAEDGAPSAWETAPPIDPATDPAHAESLAEPVASSDVVWPNETAGTAERAIVTEATTPLMRFNVWKDEILAWLRTLVSAAVYAILIVTFGFQVARVEGQSMAPTLADQDRLIVNKLAYRIGSPRREDIVMLYYPPDPDKSFVKRVIAEENQLVKIEDGRVFVNDVPIDDDYVPPEFRSHDDFPATVVKEGYYFVMGDHRNNSSDSRIWGEVPKKYIIGKVQLRWWPLTHARLF